MTGTRPRSVQDREDSAHLLPRLSERRKCASRPPTGARLAGPRGDVRGGRQCGARRPEVLGLAHGARQWSRRRGRQTVRCLLSNVSAFGVSGCTAQGDDRRAAQRNLDTAKSDVWRGSQLGPTERPRLRPTRGARLFLHVPISLRTLAYRGDVRSQTSKDQASRFLVHLPNTYPQLGRQLVDKGSGRNHRRCVKEPS